MLCKVRAAVFSNKFILFIFYYAVPGTFRSNVKVSKQSFQLEKGCILPIWTTAVSPLAVSYV